MKCFLLCFFLMFSFFSFSQKYEFKSFSINDGLPQSQVYDIAEDNNGNLWLATRGGGIAQFDGSEFRVFTTKDGLVNNFASTVFHDSKDNIWIGTSNGISLYNGVRFRNFKLEGESFKVSVLSVAENKKQELFFGTDHGVYKRVNRKNLNISKEIGLPSNSVLDVFVDSNGYLWIAHKKGFSRYKKKDSNHFSNDELSSVFPQCFAEGLNQNIWVGTYGRGLIKVRGDNYQFVPETDGLSIVDIHKDGNVLWLSTVKNGILLYDQKEKVLQSLKNDKKTLLKNCRKVFKDSWGSKWLGTSGAGLFKYSQPEITSFKESNGLVGEYIYTVSSSLDSGIWVSTNARKLFKIVGDELYEYGLNKNIYPLKIKAILEDTQGRLWLGTEGSGLMLWDNGITKMLKHGKYLISSFIQDIVEDKKGNIWVATTNGLTRFGPDLSASHYSTKMNSIHFNRLSCLHVDRSDRVWYGTRGGGLGCISDSGFVVFNQDKGLRGGVIRDITEDKLGNLFIATADEGLAVINIYSNDLNVKSISKQDGTDFSNIYSVFCDKNNQLWLGGVKGVNRVIEPLRKTKKIISYGFLEGFTGLETNQSAVCSDLNQNIYWGTINGIMVKSSFDIQRESKPPKISLSSVSLFYKNIQGTKYEPNIYNWYRTSDLIFDFDDNHIGFELDGNDLSRPEGIQYLYRLDGGDGRWSPLRYQKEVFFSNLSPGKYIFQAKAVNKDGLESETLEFYFTISAPFYYEIWFFLVSAFIISGTIFWLVRRRIDIIKVKNNEVTEKLRLEKEVLKMEQKALRLQMNPHFLFNALNSIQDQIRFENREGARQSLNNLSKLMRQILDSSRRDYISLELELSILRSYLSIEKLARKNSFEFSIEVSPEIDSDEEGIPPMMVQPFLENAIIHGISSLESVGKINIDLSIDQDFLWIKIKDNGVGRKKAKELKSQQFQQHKSVALEVIQSRLQNLSDSESFYEAKDDIKNGKIVGTQVILKLKRKVIW